MFDNLKGIVGDKTAMDISGNKDSSSRSSFELMQVSKETQKINQMIDSWSKGANIDEQSKNIAQGLLKSALKLQESMVMLSRLQEASKFMAQTKKAQSKPRETYEKQYNSVPDKKSSVNASEYRSMYPLCHTKFSADGSSLTYSDEVIKNSSLSSQALPYTRECSLQRSGNQNERNDFGLFQSPNYRSHSEGEVNKMIKDSLFKPKLLSILCDEKKNNCRKSHCGVFPEVQSSSFATSLPKSSESNKARQPMKTSKAPNLIARLMGLEEFPEEPVFKSTPQEHEMKNGSYYHLKPGVDIQMPKALNLQSDRATNEVKKELKEKIDSMSYLEMLRTLPREHPEYLRVHDRAEEFPPILIIEPLADLSREGGVEQSLTDLMPRKIKVSQLQKSVSKDMESTGGRALNSSKQKTTSHYDVEQRRIKPAPRKFANARKGFKNERKSMEEHSQKFSQIITTRIKNKDKVQSRKGPSEMSVDQTPRIEMDSVNLRSRSSAVNPIAREKFQRENKKILSVTQEYTNQRIRIPSSTDADYRRIGQDGSKSPSIDCIDASRKFSFTTVSCRQNLLLTSPLFLGKMEKHFGLQILNLFQPLSSNHAKNNTDGIRTLLSCANELLERKYCEMALVCHPLLQNHLRCKNTTSLDSLMDEVITGIDSFRDYCKVDTRTCQTVGIFSILGKDLLCRSTVVSGVWDRSWLDGVFIEETEVVVNEIGKDILGWLIEEAVISLAMQVSPSRIFFSLR